MVINQSAARRFFPGESPIGGVVRMAGTDRTIVGVVKATRDLRLDTPTEPQWYLPLYFEGSELIVRVRKDPRRFTATLRGEILASDPRMMVGRVQPFDDIIGASVFERRMAMRLLSAFAGIALALSTVGLHGVLNFSTAQRRRELGVRAAPGAQRRDVMGIVLRHGITLAGIGIGSGLLASVVVTRALRSLLFDVTPTDPATLGTIAGTLVLVFLAACMVPAWRAGRADPITALRGE